MADTAPADRKMTALEASIELHQRTKKFTGRRVMQNYPTLLTICESFKPTTLLDYGCGKGEQFELRNFQQHNWTIPSLQEGLGVEQIVGYDPCVPKFAAKPSCSFGGVIVNDVLEYVAEAELQKTLDEIFAYAELFVFLSATCKRPNKAIVEDNWSRNEAAWLNWIVTSALSRPHVTWFAKIGDGENKPRIFRGRGDRLLLVDYTQLGWSFIDKQYIRRPAQFSGEGEIYLPAHKA